MLARESQRRGDGRVDGGIGGEEIEIGGTMEESLGGVVARDFFRSFPLDWERKYRRIVLFNFFIRFPPLSFSF